MRLPTVSSLLSRLYVKKYKTDNNFLKLLTIWMKSQGYIEVKGKRNNITTVKDHVHTHVLGLIANYLEFRPINNKAFCF